MRVDERRNSWNRPAMKNERTHRSGEGGKEPSYLRIGREKEKGRAEMMEGMGKRKIEQ